MTLDQLFYTFTGKCEYILLSGKNFQVTVQNIPCGLVGITCRKAVTVTVNGMKYEINKGTKMWYQGEKVELDNNGNADLPGGVSVRRSGLFCLVIFQKIGLIIQHDKGERIG